MGNKYIPELRFPGFSGEWEQMKLGEIVEIKDSARISNTKWVTNGVPYLRSSDLANGEIGGELFISDETYQSYKDKTGAPEKDDVLFTSGGKVGVTYHKIDNKPVYVQGGSILYAKTSTSNKLSGIFLKTFFSSPRMTKYMEGASTGLTIKHFTLKPANAAPIFISSIIEQKKIGEFFKKIDDTIELHQQELTTLKQTKQGFLQKMFPKEGESVPEVRFPGFAGDWEERKLAELAEIIGGGTPSTNVKEYWDGDIDWYSPVEVGKEIYAFGSQRKITKLGLKKSSAKVLPANKTILFTSRAGIGDMAILKRNGATNQGFQSLVINNDYNIYFVYSMGNKIKEFALKHSSGSTFLEISGNNLGKMDLLVPSLEEQDKIGDFFKKLDEKISLHQRELDALKETKKAFLQKMFV